jgi:hypothetical protein
VDPRRVGKGAGACGRGEGIGGQARQPGAQRKASDDDDKTRRTYLLGHEEEGQHDQHFAGALLGLGHGGRWGVACGWCLKGGGGRGGSQDAKQ